MGRELYFGRVGSSFDARIARPGFDALLDDVNDKAKISFAASRESFARVAEAGTVSGLNVWVNFVQSYPDVPVVEIAIKRGSNLLRGHMERVVTAGGGITYTRSGTLYVAVVEQTRFKITRPANWPSPINLGDTFRYFVVQ